MKEAYVTGELSGLFSWRDALGLLERLCGGRADISYGDRLIANTRLPALEVRLDAPALLFPPEVAGGVHHWAGTTVALGEEGVGHAMYGMPASGAGATVYHAFLSMAGLLDQLGASLSRGAFAWAWYSIPLAPFCDDLALCQNRWRAAAEKGAVLSLWMSAETDEALQTALRGLPACGEVRIHNLKTANTVLTGSVDETGLIRAFGLQ